jgi:8-oxo-dGTP diphosphatase
MIYYVLGFAFGHDFNGGKRVLLIRKTKPAWMKGLANGIGGKIEPNERSLSAMTREFKEECGIETDESEWTQFAVMAFPYAVVYCYAANLTWDRFKTAVTKTEEEVVSIRVDSVWCEESMNNLAWLIPMAEAALENFSGFPLNIQQMPSRVL